MVVFLPLLIEMSIDQDDRAGAWRLSHLLGQGSRHPDTHAHTPRKSEVVITHKAQTQEHNY